MNSLGRDTALCPSWYGLEGTPLSSREHLSSRERRQSRLYPKSGAWLEPTCNTIVGSFFGCIYTKTYI